MSGFFVGTGRRSSRIPEGENVGHGHGRVASFDHNRKCWVVSADGPEVLVEEERVSRMNLHEGSQIAFDIYRRDGKFYAENVGWYRNRPKARDRRFGGGRDGLDFFW